MKAIIGILCLTLCLGCSSVEENRAQSAEALSELEQTYEDIQRDRAARELETQRLKESIYGVD